MVGSSLNCVFINYQLCFIGYFYFCFRTPYLPAVLSNPSSKENDVSYSRKYKKVTLLQNQKLEASIRLFNTDMFKKPSATHLLILICVGSLIIKSISLPWGLKTVDAGMGYF